MTGIAERVAAGAAFLDEHDPGWWKPDGERAIDLGLLDLAEPADCILGQRCPVSVLARYCFLNPGDEDALSRRWWRAYEAYAAELSGLESDRDALARWGGEHGFSSWTGSWDAYPDLTAEWKRVITGRRSAS